MELTIPSKIKITGKKYNAIIKTFKIHLLTAY